MTMTMTDAARAARSHWPPRRVAAAALASALFALAVGVPTGLVPTAFFTRMTPVLWWNYAVWPVAAVLGGLVVATYIRRPGHTAPRNGAAAASGGGLVTAFAVGCPVCNKPVVAVLGTSGAVTVWAPVQPVLAVLSIVGLVWALRRRLRSEYACPVSTRPRSASAAIAADPFGCVGDAPAHPTASTDPPAQIGGQPRRA